MFATVRHRESSSFLCFAFRCIEPGIAIVPTLRRGNAVRDAPASRTAGAVLRSHAGETVKVFDLEQKQKPSPRRHEGHEVFNALSLINYFFFVNFVSSW